MKKTGIISFFLILVLNLAAQNSLLFYTFQEIPQSSLINPAFRQTCRFHFSIPALGSIHTDIGSSGFAYSDIVTPEGYNLDYLVSHAHRMDYISSEVHANLLSFGMEYKEFYFSINLSNKLNSYFGYPNTLLEIPWYGNAAFIDQAADLSRLALDINYYHEISLGVSYRYDYQWQFGANAKVLFGLANTHTSSSNITLNTDPDNYSLLFNSQLIQNISFPLIFSTNPATGFINNVELGELDPLSMILNFSNVGFAIDLGIKYQFTEQLSFSGSLVDLGFIRYKTDVHNLTHEGEMSYGGYAGNNVTTYLGELWNEISTNFGFNETQNTYHYVLPTQLYLSGEFKPTKFFEFGIVNRNQVLSKKIKTSFAIYSTILPNDRFAFMLSYGLINNGFNNVGAGVVFKTSIVQFHLVTNNIIGLIYPYGSRDLNVRFGLNVIFGCTKKKRKAPESMGGCYWVKDYK